MVRVGFILGKGLSEALLCVCSIFLARTPDWEPARRAGLGGTAAASLSRAPPQARPLGPGTLRPCAPRPVHRPSSVPAVARVCLVTLSGLSHKPRPSGGEPVAYILPRDGSLVTGTFCPSVSGGLPAAPGPLVSHSPHAGLHLE